MNAPCLKCENHTQSCHVTCDIYIEYSKGRQELRDKRLEHKARLNDFFEVRKKGRKKK